MTTVVIGGGWAGLAAAVELAAHNIPVTVVEASRQLGGRARALRFGAAPLDNGQHVLLGAYRSFLRLLRTIGVAESQVLRRLPLDLRFLDGTSSRQLRAPRLPAPLNLLGALAGMHGLRPWTRATALRMAIALWRDDFDPGSDCTVAQYLDRHGQSSALVRALWQPLCLAALNTPVEQASGRLFARVLRETFFGSRSASDILIPITDLGRCFPEPAREFVERHGGSVRLACRALAIDIDQNKVRAVRLEHDTLPADHVIVATGVSASHALLHRHEAFSGICARLKRIKMHPICTVYLQYPQEVTLGREFVALLGTTVQWLFDRGLLTGENGLIAAIISGPGRHMSMDSDTLLDLVTTELARQFPHWPSPSASKLVRERRATFAATGEVDAARPSFTTDVDGVWLAGDYTATGFPATLEGAVSSGVECAQLILRQ